MIFTYLRERRVFLPYLQYCFCENPRGLLQLIDRLYLADHFLVLFIVYSFVIKKYIYILHLYLFACSMRKVTAVQGILNENWVQLDWYYCAFTSSSTCACRSCCSGCRCCRCRCCRCCRCSSASWVCLWYSC